jgi:molybdenum cofactor cytidylyltransferase
MSLTKNVAAIILAAGGSLRLGKPKQLLQFRGKSLVRRVADAAIEANCKPVVVVAGSAENEVRLELSDAKMLVVENKNWRRGIGSSIHAGVQYLIDSGIEIDAAVLLVCDQPHVDATVIKKLIELHTQTNKAIVASSYGGSFGVPALFDHTCFEKLLALPNDGGAKRLIEINNAVVAEFPFGEGAIDVDTEEDWQAAQLRLS